VTVVVTGAASGIGLAIARALVADGTAVVGVDLAEGEFVTVVGDVGDWDTHERAADAAGGLTGWVNNAGVNVSGPAHTVGPDEIAAGLRVLQLGPMYGTAVAVRRLLPTGGSIVNVSSIQGVAAFPGFFVWSGSARTPPPPRRSRACASPRRSPRSCASSCPRAPPTSAARWCR